MALDGENSKSYNEDNDVSNFDIDKVQLLSQNPKVKSLVRQIMEKLACNKKYKKNSIEMLNELKNELIEVLNNQRKNENGSNIG